MADEKIGTLAENTKKLAFLHALEDRDDEDDDLDFISMPEGPSFDVSDESQSAVNAASDTIIDIADRAIEPSSAAAAPVTQKRKADNLDHRRGQVSKRPRTELELKKTLSDLIDDPVLIPESQFSDNDEDFASPDNDDHTDDLVPFEEHSLAPREHTDATSRQVTNRLALAQVSDSSTNAAAGAAMAFQMSDSTAPVFKVPALLRRATTNLSTASTSSSTSSSGVTMPNGVEKAGGTKRGGSKKSNIHYQAREAERRRAVEEAERRRKDGVRKKVTGRASGGSVLGHMFSTGRGGFE